MALLLRLNKAAPLTNAEVDANFTYLDGRITSLDNVKLSTTNLLTQMKLVDGVGSGLDADKLHNMVPSDQSVNLSIVSRDASGNFSANVITANQFVGTVSTATTAVNVSGIVAVANGGTGVSALTAGYIKSNGTTLLSTTSIPGADISGDITGQASNVTGVVGVAHGGTGATTVDGIRSALGLIVGQTIQGYSANLQALSGLSTTGLVAKVNGVFQGRTLTAGAGISITNGDGIAGNPQVSISTVDVAHGGTGANTPSSARASLGAAPIVSPNFEGTPTATTASFGTATQQLATCEFVVNNGVPPGTIFTTAALTAPQGYLQEDGGSYLAADYPALYAVIGTRFGEGNGPGTFRVRNVNAGVGVISIIKT